MHFCVTIFCVLRVFLNLAGLQNVEEIAEKAAEIMKSVDTNQDGRISRQEWRRSWKSVKSLREFRDRVTDDTVRAEMVAKYGRSGPAHIPLYAFGNQMTFYRLPMYPKDPEEHPGGYYHILILYKMI